MAITKKVGTGTLVGGDFYTSLPFWGDLSQTEQKTVREGTEGAAVAHQHMRQCRAEVAVQLLKVYEVLEPKKVWTKYLHTLEHSQRSSYRWVNRLRELALPAPVVDAAIKRGMDIIHTSYLEPFRQTPAPKKDDPRVIEPYLNKIQGLHDKGAAPGAKTGITAVEAEKRAWRAVIHQWKALRGTKRSEWALRLIGRLMAEMGIPAQRIEPEAVPEDFEPKPGYPAGRARK